MTENDMCLIEAEFQRTLSTKVIGLMNENGNWDRTRTKHGQTQVSEKIYMEIIKTGLLDLGATIGREAGSQQYKDLQDVKIPGVDYLVSYECKKINGGNQFMCNDTVPKSDVRYLHIYVDKKQVVILKGSTLLNEPMNPSSRLTPKKALRNLIITAGMIHGTDDYSSSNIGLLLSDVLKIAKACVLTGNFSYFEFGQLFKRTISFGRISFRPRPNAIMKLPAKLAQELEADQFLNIV